MDRRSIRHGEHQPAILVAGAHDRPLLGLAKVVKLDLDVEDVQIRPYRARLQTSFKLEEPS